MRHFKKGDHPKNWRVPPQELDRRRWRVGGQFDDFDGSLLALFGINFLSCFPSFCIGFLSACVHVLLACLRRRSSPDVYSQTRASSSAPLVFQCADNVGLPPRLEEDGRREQSSGSGSDCSTSRTGKGSLRPDICQQNPFFSLERSVAPYGTLAASVVSPPLRHRMAKLLGHSRGFSKGYTRGDRTSMTAAEKEAASFVRPGFGADHDGPTPSAEDSHVQVPVVASRSRQFQTLVCRR